jgi:hypothetical protein
MRFLTSQKNKLFDTIANKQLNPSMFNYIEDENQMTINYINSDWYFSFKATPNSALNSHQIKYSPGQYEFEIAFSSSSDWSKVELHFEYWCNYLLREISIEDKWKRLDQEIRASHISFESETDKFSFSEYKDIEVKIQVLKERVKLISLESTQLEAIENKLDHLIIQAETLSKFDWKSLFIGTMVNIIIQLSVSPTNAKALWDLIKQVFTGYFLN